MKRYKDTMRDAFDQQIKTDSNEWAELNKINLTEFMYKTNPLFFIWKCELNDINCKFLWKLRSTYLGRCLELDPARVAEDGRKKSLAPSFQLSLISMINYRYLSAIRGCHKWSI